MAYTEEQITERIETLELGLSTVEAGATFADRGVTYRSVEQIKAAIAYWQNKLDALGGGHSRQFFGVASKGFC